MAASTASSQNKGTGGRKPAKDAAKPAASKTTKKTTAKKKAAKKTAKGTAKSAAKVAEKDIPRASATGAAGAAGAGKEGGKAAGNSQATVDPAAFARNMFEAASRAQGIVRKLMQSQKSGSSGSHPDPLNLSSAFFEFLSSWASDPARVMRAQAALWQDQMALWQNTWRRMMGMESEPLIEPARGDKRFRHEDWAENIAFDFIKQSYLLTARWMQNTVAEAEHLDPETRRKLEFYTRQFADAISPSNFALTNPEVLRETMRSSGENIVRGLSNLERDLERGQGRLAITQTDMSKFQVGVNIATTPGKVIYQNDIMQLLQYEPASETVYKRPLLIFPPWINKFYILDLQPKNSFIKWATEQGYTVFVVSWVNPDEKLAEKTFEDYMREGIFDALDAVEKATGEREINTIGYCIGGTLLGATLAYMAQKGDVRIKSATFFAAQLDFTEAGELQVFIDDEQLKALEAQMEASGGTLPGQTMATTFNMLRANDLIWSFVVNNYLMGRDPIPFDLLYWNADSTRMPSRMHLFYLRECYRNNALAKGEMVLGGVKLDLSKVKIPVYLQSSRDDHIAPYRSVYRATKLLGGPVKFIVAGSGHIAGVINHPDAKKYQHWTNDALPDDADDWLASATEHPGSWWPDWHKWLSAKSGPRVPARRPGDGKLKPIEDAPGSYVKVMAH
jgi:polyhydroxyalkanoate synthase